MLDVGGFIHDSDGAAVHLKWCQQSLQVGQVITLAIVETKQVDPPLTREREDPHWVEQKKREYYERTKREYGDT
jgi:hypothetical protein